MLNGLLNYFFVCRCVSRKFQCKNLLCKRNTKALLKVRENIDKEAFDDILNFDIFDILVLFF